MQRVHDSQQGPYNWTFEPKCLDHLPPSMSSSTLRTADLESDEHSPHLWLRGRANTVFPMKSEMLACLSSKHPHHNPHEQATKLHWPDDSHQSEPGMLNAVHEIAQRKPQEDGHIPEMIWLHQVKETCAAKLRRGLEIDDPVRCSRMLNIHLSWKLHTITKLSEKDFKRAWWMVIICTCRSLLRSSWFIDCESRPSHPLGQRRPSV